MFWICKLHHHLVNRDCPFLIGCVSCQKAISGISGRATILRVKSNSHHKINFSTFFFKGVETYTNRHTGADYVQQHWTVDANFLHSWLLLHAIWFLDFFLFIHSCPSLATSYLFEHWLPSLFFNHFSVATTQSGEWALLGLFWDWGQFHVLLFPGQNLKDIHVQLRTLQTQRSHLLFCWKFEVCIWGHSTLYMYTVQSYTVHSS